MNFLINESQLELILEEIKNPRMMESVRRLNSFGNKILNRVAKKYGLNIRLLLTWGPSMAGLIMPLDNFIKTGDFSLNDNQISLILCGVAGVLFYDNSENLKKVKDLIKSEGIEKQFQIILQKGIDLKKSFVEFIKSLRVSLTSSSEILSYAFLVPIIPDLVDFLSTDKNFEKTILLISKRVIASGLVLAVADVLSEILRRATRLNQ